MTGDKVSISVEGVSKTFKLPHEKTSSIKGALINIARRKKGFEKQHVLKGVSFEVKKGEFFGIVGRNGSGKSTLLKLLAGIYVPDKGNIAINGRLTPFIELGVGFNHELTGRENVFLNGALLGFNRKEMSAMYDDIVKFAELERFMDQKLKNYSSGMQVRLAFSIAIRVQSDILVLDEVLAVGDAAFQKKCYDYFMLLKKNKRTVILVTHDMGAVRQYCDRAIMVNNGEIVKQGKPEKIAQAYQKLFTDELSEGKEVKPRKKTSKNHWGTGDMVCLAPKVKLDKTKLTIASRFKAKVDIPPPVMGFTIFGPAGVNILEGNTLRSHFKTRALKAGDEVELTWQVPNIFAMGNYTVSIACCDESTTEFYDWFNEAASFEVMREYFTSGVVDPRLTIDNYVVKE
jgi:ABC-2 type transport system ATP-binding protein